MRPGILHGAVALACAVLAASTAAQASLVISKARSNNVVCTGGVCVAGARHAVLNVQQLKSLLAAGDVTVQSGSAAQDIEVDAALTWTGTSRLTLDAVHSIAVANPIGVRGAGAVTIAVNSGATDGDFAFSGSGRIDFWDTSSSLTIDGNAYTLANSLNQLAADVNGNPSGFHALAKNTDASGDDTFGGIASVSGTVEGLGHAISNLSLTERGSASSVGLIAIVAAGGTVRDLALVSATIAVLTKGNTSSAGLLAGHNTGTVHRCAAGGTIDGRHVRYLGGLVGYNEGRIDYSTSSAGVGSGLTSGGLAGLNDTGGEIDHSSATGSVGSVSIAGGLVGFNFATINASFATGGVDGVKLAGGLAGWNDTGAIVNSYATGAVHGGTTGGLVGKNGNTPTITGSYAVGAVSGTGPTGGFAGNTHPGNILADYWDTDTAGAPGCGAGSCKHITGLTTAQLQSGLPAGFDPTVYAEDPAINGGFPYLIENPPK